MQSTKKTNPSEFLLHNYQYLVDATPENYFNRFRYELFLQKLLFWFFNRYGLFFFISQLKIRDYFFLVQFYYYKTYLFQEFVLHTQDFYALDSSKYFFKTVQQQQKFFGGSSL